MALTRDRNTPQKHVWRAEIMLLSAGDEAASAILTRRSVQSSLRTWGLHLRERIGFKRAAVAVARKLAVIMHTMLKTGEFFNPIAGMTA